MANKKSDNKTKGLTGRKWHLIDAQSESFGRMSSKIAMILRGKNKATFTPHLDEGDYVIVVNTDNLKFTKDKNKKKLYHRWTGYPGNVKTVSLEEQINKDSRKIIHDAVYGMLPKNRMRDVVIKRLKIYKDGNHPYADKLTK